MTQETVQRTPSPNWDALHRAQALQRSLRLLKPGTPRLHAHAVVQVSHFPLWEPTSICFDWVGWRLYEPEVILQRRDLGKLKQRWQDDAGNLPSVRRTDSRLELGESRFLSTYGKGSWIEHVVDLTIAIEALLAPRGEGELSYRLATRAAHLLGRRGEPDQRVHKIVKTMYDVRSKTVHGTPSDESLHSKWLSKISNRPYRWVEGTFKLVVPATEEARSVVRSLIVGCRQIAESQGKAAAIRWPLPDDFEYQMMDIRRRRAWQRFFPPRLAADWEEG